MGLFRLLNGKKPKPTFIKKPIFDFRDDFVTDLYQLAYFPPFPSEEFFKLGITRANSTEAYKAAVNVVKALSYQLYQIPAVRNYYGKDFVHGFTAKYDPTRNVLVYDNLDDTPEAIQYTKEITAALEVIFKAFLVDCNAYIYYQGDCIQFVTDEELKKLRKIKQQNRIIWVE